MSIFNKRDNDIAPWQRSARDHYERRELRNAERMRRRANRRERFETFLIFGVFAPSVIFLSIAVAYGWVE